MPDFTGLPAPDLAIGWSFVFLLRRFGGAELIKNGTLRLANK